MFQNPGIVKENTSLIPFDAISNGDSSSNSIGKGKNVHAEGGFERVFSKIAKKNVEKSDKLNNKEKTNDTEKLGLKREIESLLKKLLKSGNRDENGGDRLTKLEVKKLIKRLESLIKFLLKKIEVNGDGKNSKKEGVGKSNANLIGFLRRFLKLLEKLDDVKEIGKGELFELLDTLMNEFDKKELARFLEEIESLEKKDNQDLVVKGDSSNNNQVEAVFLGEGKLRVNRGDEKNNSFNKLRVRDLRSKDSEVSKTKHFKDMKSSKSVKLKDASVAKRGYSKTSSSGAKASLGVKGLNFTDLIENNATGTFENTAKASERFSGIIARIKTLLENKGFKQGNIIVRDEGNGEIRLILKPKSLGNIRIKLNILDNRIEGKIFVENNTVKAILNNNISSLRDVLKNGGFQSAFLEVSVSGESSNGREGRESLKGNVGGSKRIVEEIDSIIPKLVEIERDDLVIDMVV